MDLHAALGAEPPPMRRRDEAGRFLPVRLVRRLEDIMPAVEAVTTIFSAQVAEPGDLLPAMQWIVAVAEILENVFLPVTLLLDESRATLAAANAAGRRYFQSVEALMKYVREEIRPGVAA